MGREDLIIQFPLSGSVNARAKVSSSSLGEFVLKGMTVLMTMLVNCHQIHEKTLVIGSKL